VTRIKNLFSKRIVTLIALVAIAGSSLASMAALTGTLTVTSTFAGAQILISGNGQTGSATLFDVNAPVAPGETLYAALEVQNVGNIAAMFDYLPPQTITGSGNLKDLMLARVYNKTGLWGTDAELVASCNDGSLIGWEPQMAAAKWDQINVSSFALNPDQSRLLCYSTTVPTGSVIDANSTMQVDQHFTGTEQ
jgi:hypothetical protein